MKPILDWYDQLPEPIRSQAIENYDEEGAISPVDGLNRASFSAAIHGGFSWYKTPEGHEYWANIFYKAIKGEFDIKK